MTGFRRALGAEALKLRRTLALWMVLGTPALVVLLQWYMYWRMRRPPQVGSVWEMYAQGGAAVWAIFMLPLFVALEATLVTGSEHVAKGWKLMFAMPVSRSAVYTAKLVTAAALVGAGSLVLAGGMIVSGWSFRLLRPGFGFEQAVPVGVLLEKTMLPFLAAGMILALHTWSAARWPSYTLSLGIGVGGTFFTVFATGSDLGKVWPWTLPVNTIASNPQLVPLALAIGLGGGLAVAVLGAWDVGRRDAQ